MSPNHRWAKQRGPRWLAAVIAFAALGMTACSSVPVPDVSVYDWAAPLGFPAPRVPLDNPMNPDKVALGRALFYDKRLSGNLSYSCASCHQQRLAFTDALAQAVGSTGDLHPRSTMSLANVAYNSSYAWADSKLTSLEQQARVPMFNEHPIELGLAGREQELLQRLGASPDLRRRFEAAFRGETAPVTLDNIVKALAAFQRTLISGNSAYDRLVYLDDREALAPSAWRGMRLFFSERLRCAECHSGFNFSGAVVYRSGGQPRGDFHNTALYDVDGRGAYPADNRGLAEVTRRSRDTGRFRAPTLRNIALTAPYMHDGSVATLAEVIDHYAAGGRASGNRRKSPLLTGFTISDREKSDLVLFLESLTDHEFVSDPRFSDPRLDNAVMD